MRVREKTKTWGELVDYVSTARAPRPRPLSSWFVMFFRPQYICFGEKETLGNMERIHAPLQPCTGPLSH